MEEGAERAGPVRRLPAVGAVLERAGALVVVHGRAAVTASVRIVLAEARVRLLAGEAAVPSIEGVVVAAGLRLAAQGARALRPVINATGIVLHTNLGRAPLAEAAVAAVAAVARGYCNLEFDLETGRRGARAGGVEALLQALTGAEAAVAVNNGAAAILLALAALAEGGEVIVSRGELVEVGGGFRIPDVIRQGGASLVEVGTTNRTRVGDYRAAIGPRTRVLLKVHQSNFRVVGFTAETGFEALAALGREHGLPVVADLGSGVLQTMAGVAEPTLGAAMQAGVDVVTCSGDKLLGGPQAGLIAGRKAALDVVRRHPLLRAVRLDKMSLAALEATLALWRDQPEAVPVRRMLLQDEATIRARAERLAGLIGAGRVIRTDGFAGGGSLPTETIASWGVALEETERAGLLDRLRLGTPAIVGRMSDGSPLLDLLAVSDGDVESVAARVAGKPSR